MSEDRSAQGARQETDGVGAEGGYGAQRRIGQWKEQLVEDESGRRAVDQEIVPLDRRADGTRRDDARHLGRLIGRVLGA
jgi:hypothetical protein